MPERPPDSILAADTPTLIRKLAKYRSPDPARSLFELAITVGAFVALWVLCWAAVRSGYWIGLLATIPAAGFLVRLFLIQHDCGHRSFFASRAANDWIGRILSIVTLTPYDVWRRSHAMHHATSGNLDRRGIGDVDTLTVSEFRARGPAGKMAYRLYRHPAVMFGIGPAYLFVLRYRLPSQPLDDGWRLWASAMATNAATLGVVLVMIWLVGLAAFLAVQLPITLLGSTMGVWLFYVQHQFEGTVWERNVDWDIQHAALQGSSHYDLPPVLRWFSANIGVHHVHHLASRIPYYRLPSVLRDQPELRRIGRLTLVQSLRSVRLVLWDEDSRRLISFSEAATTDRRAAALPT
jgi:omega-6 fatty acid desaturase (delta-12 desaturase)